MRGWAAVKCVFRANFALAALRRLPTALFLQTSSFPSICNPFSEIAEPAYPIPDVVCRGARGRWGHGRWKEGSHLPLPPLALLLPGPEILLPQRPRRPLLLPPPLPQPPLLELALQSGELGPGDLLWRAGVSAERSRTRRVTKGRLWCIGWGETWGSPCPLDTSSCNGVGPSWASA